MPFSRVWGFSEKILNACVRWLCLISCQTLELGAQAQPPVVRCPQGEPAVQTFTAQCFSTLGLKSTLRGSTLTPPLPGSDGLISIAVIKHYDQPEREGVTGYRSTRERKGGSGAGAWGRHLKWRPRKGACSPGLPLPAFLYNLGPPNQGRHLPQGTGPFHINH